ncbi:MAG: hypothetical protein K2J29_02160 [Muribaculaceae bacterium]|nr:hypothetical protein [Bacteroides sp.]MDE6803422.1 hypothetical protein [Muribaculaceae bacterium]
MRHHTFRIVAVTMMLLSIVAHAVVPHHNHHGVVVTMHQADSHSECAEHHSCSYVMTVRQCDLRTSLEINIPSFPIILPGRMPDLVPAERLLLRMTGPRRAPPGLMALARAVIALRAPPLRVTVL